MPNTQSTLDTIAEIIESISGVSRSDLGPDTDLLDLGLDSLMFVRIGRVLESQYRVDISMKRFYDELSNLRALADYLSIHGQPQALEQGSEQPPVADTESDPALSQQSLAAQTVARSVTAPVSATASISTTFDPAKAADINTVMSAHMALMRRYLNGVAAGATNVPEGGAPNAMGKSVAAAQSPASQSGQEHSDALDTRKKFSGIETQKASLTEQQQTFVTELVTRLSQRCQLSKQMADEGKTWLADWKYSLQFKQDLKELRFPVVCATASGSRFTDVDGNEYVDIAMGMGVHYFGHSPAFIDRAVQAQLTQNLALGPQSRLAPDVARRVCAMTGHQRAAFFVTGSDAVMLALRLVRAARARDKVVMFAGAYHGICSDVLAAQGENGAVPMSPGLTQGMVSDLVVLDYDAPESLDHIRAMGDQLAGVLVEPVQSRNPALQPQRFLRQLRALCTELDIPLIFDEMVNGFRQAAGGMQEWFGVKSDLSTYGKIIGGGYPLSVIAGHADLMQWIDGGVWRYGDDSAPLADSIATGGTHNKHPVALAAASAVLDHIEGNPGLFDTSRMRMIQLADRINVWFERNAVPLRLTYFGTQFKFESFASSLELELFFYLLLEKGIYTWELHVANLSTEHTQSDADQLFAAVAYAVESLRAGGFGFRAEKLRRQYVPMSSVQKRLYAITQRDGAEKPYHLAGAWRLQGSVDAARLEDCIHQVIIRHESLRTAFVVVDGEFYQRIVAEPRFFLDRIELKQSATLTSTVDALLDDYIQPFNLLEPPLLRVGLATEEDGSHLLLMDVHHIVADGLSMNVVLQEILALYDDVRLEPVRSQARHVHDTVDQYLVGEQSNQDARFWCDALSPYIGTQDQFDLSPDYDRPPVTSFAGKRIALKLEPDATAALHQFCSKARISTFGALFAVFVAWTWRYTRQQHFIVGLPASGRPDAAADNAVGMFVNTLAFPADVDESDSVTDFLKQVRDRLFDVQQHSDYPFSAVLNDLKVSHGTNRNPLFDVMFSYENAGSRTIKTRSFAGETLCQYEGAGMFDISMDLIEAENSILINCAYAESLFSDATMSTRLTEYLRLLETLVTGQAETLLDWVQAASKVPGTADSLAVVENKLAAKEPLPETIWSQWLWQLAAGKHDIALIEGELELTYAEVDEQVRKTAFTLFNLYGVRPGDRVVVNLDASVDLMVAMLALFSMGAVYVPVTPDTPLKRLRQIVQKCGARHLLYATGHVIVAELDGDDAVECIAMDDIDSAALPTTQHQTLLPPQVDDPAYVIFTSGSTGEPKGVEILHSGIGNAVAWRIRSYRLSPADTTLQMPSPSFDASLIDILSALLSGGKLIILDTASKRSVERIRETIEKYRVSAMLLTPTLYRVLLDQIAPNMASLRFVTLAGEKLPVDLMQAHFVSAPAVELWNEYGPTECSVVVSAARMMPDDERVTIGRPIFNTRVHILDERERPAPTGVWGRLWVSGIGLAKGYVGDDAATQSKFRCLPAVENMRCYDTGDVVRILDTGELQFRGRDDSQVKVNGYRIELEDVEAALRSELKLSEVATRVVDNGTSASLHGWIVADAEPSGWRDALQAKLPAWMVPVSLHLVDTLPALASGKLNREALNLPEGAVTEKGTPAATDVLPGSNHLGLLLQHCQEILARPGLKPSDNYFNIGGDSIQAIVLASRLNEAGFVLDVNDLFRTPVLSELARRIRSKDSRTVNVLPSAENILPTPMQSWFYANCNGNPDAFTQAAWLDLPAAMTLTQLTLLCRHWASQHSVFQETCALVARGQGKQTDVLPIEALVHCSGNDSGDVTDLDAVAVSARAEISLHNGPLMKVVLLSGQTQTKNREKDRKKAQTQRSLVVFHHFIVDAVSWQVLQSQWALLWQDMVADNPLRTLPEGATLRQFASALHSDEARHKALLEAPFWQSQVANVRRAFAVAPTGNASRQFNKRLSQTLSLAPDVAETLLVTGHRIFRSRGSDLLLAAFTDAVANVCDLDTVTVLMESNGRAQTYTDADFSSTLGWLTSAYPLTVETSGSVTGADWTWKIERVRDRVRRVPEQGVGYGVLRYVVEQEALTATTPEFAFNYLGRFSHQPGTEFAILEDSPAGDQLGELGLMPALELVCFADDAGLHVSMSADSGCVDAKLLKRVLMTFQQRSHELADYCNSLDAVVLPAPIDFVESDWQLESYLGLLKTNAIDRQDVASIVPVTAMQSGLIYHARSRPTDLAYLEQVDFRLQGVEATKLAAAFQSLLDDFPLLRASFIVGSEGRTAQLIRNEVKLPVLIHDISDQDPDTQQQTIDAACDADREQQFDISQPPLMRVQIFSLDKPKKRSKTTQKRNQKQRSGQSGSVHVIWTHHHLIMDGWCIGILFERLMASYLEPHSVIADVSAMDNDRLNQRYFHWLASQDRNSALAYWSTLLAGVERPTRLRAWPGPVTATLPEGQTGDREVTDYQLRQHTVQLPADLTSAMQAWGASRNATLSSVIRLTWAVLLARFSNSTDVVYGTVVSGRPPEVAGIDRAVGLFINTVPVRFKLDAALTANDALALVQEQANNSRSHEYLSLADIKEAAADLQAREPLFDHLIVLENYPMDASLRGASGAPESDNSISISDIRAFERTDLPLNLVIVPSGESLEATFLFDFSVYPCSQIEHLAEHFVHLSRVLEQRSGQALSSIDLLTEADRGWLFEQWNQRLSNYPSEQTLYDLYCDTVDNFGDRTAIHDEVGSISHADLQARVQSVAAGLLQNDAFVPGCRVALWLPRNRDMIVGMLAVLAAGGSYVALDPVYPEVRLRFIVQDSSAALVLTAAGMAEVTLGSPMADIAALADTASDSAGRPNLPTVGQESAAYVIYTSGSTGQPKGCQISHQNVVRLLRNDDFDFDFDHNDIWTAAHSFCFDFSVWEMYGALLNGGALVIPSADDVRNIETFVDLVARHKVTVLNQTPAAFYQFSRVALKRSVRELDALRMVIFGGDSLVSSRLASWVDTFPTSRVKLINMYGITETTVHVTYREVDEADISSGLRLNLVGRPLPETGVWIVDGNGSLQPPGVAGEIVISGSGVGMGYLNRDELNARKFSVLEAAGGERCYWSGDVGYISVEHGLVYLGRSDQQVQVRGFRVECEEIARSHEEHQSVSEALVVPVENIHGTELVAYLIGDETAAPAHWRPWLATRLPEYMIPSYTVWLDALPLTANGKVDRNALPDPVSIVPSPDDGVSDEIETKIISAWRQVLAHEHIGPQSNFFDVGGHSLKALTLVDVLQTQFGLTLAVADVFELPTPRQQAVLCERAVPGESSSDDDLGAFLEDVGLDELEALISGVSDQRQDS